MQALQPPPFVNIRGLAELTGVPVRSIRTLISKRVIPFIKVGHRTLLFEPSKVVRALHGFEVRSRNGRREGTP
jgi:excisionase family DNA binding protein